MERHRERVKSDNFRAGLIAAMTLNAQRTKKSQKVWQPLDFFGDDKPRKVKTADELLIQMNRLHKASKRRKGG